MTEVSHENWLGKKVKDKITGFTGTAEAWLIFYNGCERVMVRPKAKKKTKQPNAYWVDVEQLEVIDEIGVGAPDWMGSSKKRPGGADPGDVYSR